MGFLEAERFVAEDTALRRRLADDPAAAAAWRALAQWRTRIGAADIGLALAERALRLAPGDTGAALERVRALAALGRPTEAQAALVPLLLSDPDPAALLALAGLCLDGRRVEDTFVYLAQALAFRPGWAEAQTLLSRALHTAGLVGGAERAARMALDQEPGRFEARRRLAALLFEAGRFDEAYAVADSFERLDPRPEEAESIRLGSLHLDGRIGDADLLVRHRRWGETMGGGVAQVPARSLASARPMAPEQRLRIGYVSPDLGHHPVGFFLEPALAHRDRAGTEVVLYSTAVRDDAITGRLRGLADGWRACAGLSDDALDARIRGDAIDILVDLSGHTGGNRLGIFARRPAPLQVSWLGYFHTTGLPAMDYALFDPLSLPTGGERWFTEQVVRLPDGRFCYAPPVEAPPVMPPPAVRQGSITFGSFNKLEKLTPAVVALWARVLSAVPGARLVLKWRSLVDVGVQMDVRRRFRAHGIGPAQVELRGHSSHAGLLLEYGDIDVALDPFPFTGGLTSCEALWMGVPVVTLAGTRPVGRQTLSFLNALGLNDLVAADGDEYVRIAVELAANRERLVRLRHGLRPRMASSSLCDGQRFSRHLDMVWQLMWRRHAAGLPPVAFSLGPLSSERE